MDTMGMSFFNFKTQSQYGYGRTIVLGVLGVLVYAVSLYGWYVAPLVPARTGASATALTPVRALNAMLGTTTPATTTVANFHFTRNLTLGAEGADVQVLQTYLNARQFAVAPAGSAGSAGNETTYFGPSTRRALARFQSAARIDPPVGYFGPVTRRLINTDTMVLNAVAETVVVYTSAGSAGYGGSADVSVGRNAGAMAVAPAVTRSSATSFASPDVSHARSAESRGADKQTSLSFTSAQTSGSSVVHGGGSGGGGGGGGTPSSPAVPTPTPQPSSTPTPQHPTPTPRPSTPVATPTPSVTSTPSPTPTPTPSPTATATPTPTPTPSPTPTPAQSRHIAADWGIAAGGGLPALSQGELDAYFSTLQALGIGWVRWDINWNSIQSQNAQEADWRGTDRIVDTARKYGIKSLPILTYAPRWARSPECLDSDKCHPKDASQFASFAGAAVARYKSKGIQHWEIWNEPNMAGFWAPHADCAAYTALLKATYAAIKAADPHATIITGGMAPAATGDGNMAPRDFLSCIYAQGGKDSFSAVGHHPYTFPESPSSRGETAWAQMTLTTPSLRSIMHTHGDDAKKIWLTEYGAPTGGPDAHWRVSEATQAEFITGAATLYSEYEWAGPIFIYSLQDAGTAHNTNENFFGLIRHDGTHKPAYDTLQSILGN